MLTFTMKLAIVLAGASAAIATPTAVAVDSSTMLSVMGQGALDEQHFSVFIKCVQSLNSAYRAYADDGYLVVIPPTNRTIDTKTTDEGMWNCIESSLTTISLALESAEFYDPVHETSTQLATLRYTDAVRIGIKGQEVTGHVAAGAGTNALQSRAVPGLATTDDPGAILVGGTAAYFGEHASFFSDCTSENFDWYYVGKCYGWMSPVSSTSAYNADPKACLTYTIWPHHDCEQGNQRSIGVAPKTTCPCQVKKTYSFYGSYC
jgi:hypothetical protein